MQFRMITRLPTKGHIGIYKFGAISGLRGMSRAGWNPETPDISNPRAVPVPIIDLINTPVISRSRNKTIRIRKSWEAENKKDRVLVAPEGATGAVFHIVIILADIYIE